MRKVFAPVFKSPFSARRRSSGPLELALLAVGDSITAGFGVTSDLAWPAVLATLTGREVGNVSLTGRKLATMDADYATLVAPSYEAGKRNVLVLLAGSNDILNEGGESASLAAMQASMTSFLDKATTTGFEVHVCTLLMWGGIDAIKSTRREDFNAWLRANAVSLGATAVIDTAALIEFQRPYENYYWNADLVHLSANGYAHVADAVGVALGLDMAPATLYRPTGDELLWGTTDIPSVTALVNMSGTETVVATYRSTANGATITANLGGGTATTTDLSSLTAPVIVSIAQPVNKANCSALVIEDANIAGRINDLTGYDNLAFLLLPNSTISGPLPDLSDKDGLVILSLLGCKFSGPMGAIPSESLFLWNVEGNMLGGAIPDIGGNIALQFAVFKNNLFNDYAGLTMPASLVTFDASGCFLATAGGPTSVNAILVQIDATGVSGPDRAVNLTGVLMPTPSGAGVTAKTALQGKNWTVLTQ